MQFERQPGLVRLTSDSPCGLTFCARRQRGVTVLSLTRFGRTLALYLCRL